MDFLKDKKIIDKAEDFADKIFRNGKHILPHVGRLLLISTFLEDGLRMWFQWSDQSEYISGLWNCGNFLAGLFVFINLMSQLICCIMVLARLKVPIACAILGFVLLFQTVGYYMFDWIGLLRNFALIGGILLIYAENQVDSRSLFAGLPSVGDENTTKQYFQLGGRILLLFMLMSSFRTEVESVFQIIQTAVSICVMVLVAIGYKTKLCALVLVVWLGILNVYYNSWWRHDSTSMTRDVIKYDFFQVTSVMGGLLLVVAIGPGGVSLDAHKKKW